MRKKELAKEVIERLKKEQERLAKEIARCQGMLSNPNFVNKAPEAKVNAEVNIVVEKLYEKFPDVKALAEAPVEEIEEIVRPCGLGKSKARDISACMKILWEQYGGNVPEDFDSLLKLPGERVRT